MDQKLANSLQNIVEALPDALWLRDIHTGSFIYCSPCCEDVWGLPVKDLIGRPDSFLERVFLEDRPQVEDALARAVHGAPFDQQYRILFPSGQVKWIHDRGSLMNETSEGSHYLAGLARDITERRTLETELRKAYDALHSSVNGVIITNQKGVITYANPAFLSLFLFRDVADAIGTPAENLFVGEGIEELSELQDAEGDFGRQRREIAVKRRDGNRVYVEVSSSPVHDGLGNVVGNMASFLNVTDRKIKEAEARRHHAYLQRLTERMADLEESERRRISDQLHDTAVQSLSLSNIRLGSVRKIISDAGLKQAVDQLDAAREMVGEGIRQCRLIMGDLTPPLLYELGLGPALRQLAERLGSLQGIPIRVEDSTPATKVPESLRGLLFQSTRELIMNACKHAAPKQVLIQLSSSDHEVRIRVQDDGRGFDPKLVARQGWTDSGGFGLFSIRQRLERIDGDLSVDSTPGRGTTITIRVEVARQKSGEAGKPKGGL